MQGETFSCELGQCSFVHSDARSGSIIDDRIRPTLESGSAIGSTKPVLLVIDEIDGATGAGDNVRKFHSYHYLLLIYLFFQTG